MQEKFKTPLMKLKKKNSPEKNITDYYLTFGGQTSLSNHNPSLIPSFL